MPIVSRHPHRNTQNNVGLHIWASHSPTKWTCKINGHLASQAAQPLATLDRPLRALQSCGHFPWECEDGDSSWVSPSHRPVAGQAGSHLDAPVGDSLPPGPLGVWAEFFSSQLQDRQSSRLLPVSAACHRLPGGSHGTLPGGLLFFLISPKDTFVIAGTQATQAWMRRLEGSVVEPAWKQPGLSLSWNSLGPLPSED